MSCDVWTADEVAKFLRIQAATVRTLAASNRIPAKKVGRYWRFSRKEIERWLCSPGPV